MDRVEDPSPPPAGVVAVVPEPGIVLPGLAVLLVVLFVAKNE